MTINISLVDDKYLERRTRKQRKRNKNTGLQLETIEPLNENQALAFDYYYGGKNIIS